MLSWHGSAMNCPFATFLRSDFLFQRCIRWALRSALATTDKCGFPALLTPVDLRHSESPGSRPALCNILGVLEVGAVPNFWLRERQDEERLFCIGCLLLHRLRRQGRLREGRLWQMLSAGSRLCMLLCWQRLRMLLRQLCTLLCWLRMLLSRLCLLLCRRLCMLLRRLCT